MDYFVSKVAEIAKAHKKVAMFVDMDGTIVEYTVFKSKEDLLEHDDIFLTANPLTSVINKIKQINEIENVDLYILTLAKSTSIVGKKKVWLEKNAPFINKDNIIILDKETGGYTHENKIYVKTQKIEDVMNEKGYDYSIFLDDNQRLLRVAKMKMHEKCYPFHISSAIV
jgi:5'(3')-deoxyribonucleotidase